MPAITPPASDAQARALQLIADRRLYFFRATNSTFAYPKCVNSPAPAYSTMNVLNRRLWFVLDDQWTTHGREKGQRRYASLTDAGRAALAEQEQQP